MLPVLYHRTCVFFHLCCLFNVVAVGWKFWIPAASINFYCVPIQAQVRGHEGAGAPTGEWGCGLGRVTRTQAGNGQGGGGLGLWGRRGRTAKRVREHEGAGAPKEEWGCGLGRGKEGAGKRAENGKGGDGDPPGGGERTGGRLALVGGEGRRA